MRTRTTLLALAFAALVAGAAFAQSGHTGGCACGKFGSQPTPWQIEHSTAPYQNAATAEFARWNTVANVVSSALGDLSAGSPNGFNEIGLFTGVLPPDTFGLALILPDDAFGSPPFNDCTEMTSGTSCGTFTEADIIINADFERGFTPTGPPDYNDDEGPAYYGATALHEIGHTLGLHHNFSNLSTMNYYEDYGAQYLSVADAAAIRRQYPSLVKSMTDMGTYPFRYDPAKQQYSATTPVSFSPSSVAAGGQITASNLTVENVGNQNLSDVNLEFYLSTDSTITTGDILLGRLNYTSFPSSSYDDDPVNLPIPASVPSGSYFLGARVVHTGSTADSITYNNTWASPGKLTVTGGGGGGSCTPSSSNLCLNSSRFRISLAAKDPRTGAAGSGQATAFNNEVGYYSIPALTGNPNNLEVFVKVLDARVVNGKFWVFYGGLTDFEYTITITDVTTGAVKTYTKPGLVFTGGADTSAF